MITIKNIRQDGEWGDYEVQHNGLSVTVFRHKEGDGLAACLEKAAFAVEEEQLYHGKKVLLEQAI